MFTESVALWQQNNAGGVGRTIVGYMYMVGFKKNNLGLASAVGLTLLALVVAVNLVQLILMGFFRKEDADAISERTVEMSGRGLETVKVSNDEMMVLT